MSSKIRGKYPTLTCSGAVLPCCALPCLWGQSGGGATCADMVRAGSSRWEWCSAPPSLSFQDFPGHRWCRHDAACCWWPQTLLQTYSSCQSTETKRRHKHEFKALKEIHKFTQRTPGGVLRVCHHLQLGSFPTQVIEEQLGTRSSLSVNPTCQIFVTFNGR